MNISRLIFLRERRDRRADGRIHLRFGVVLHPDDQFIDDFLPINRERAVQGVVHTAAYAFYGICGWIEEWVRRGMPESEKEMMALLEMMQKKEKVD